MAHSKTLIALFGAAFILSGCSYLSDIEESLWPSLSGDEDEDTSIASEIPEELADPGDSPVAPGAPPPPPGAYPPPPPPPTMGTTNFMPQPATPGQATGTYVGGKVVQMRNDLGNLQGAVGAHNGELQNLRNLTNQHANAYHGLIAAMQSRLQNGTTPGNPVLTQQWNEAQRLVELLGNDIANMNSLSNRAAADGAMIGYLLDSARSSFNLSGAIEEDHRQLTILEDNINGTVVLVDRLLKELADDIQRQTEYVSRERRNVQTLALAVKRGQLFGGNLANPIFHSATQGSNVASSAGSPSSMSMSAASPGNRRPLVVIRFDKSDVDYQQAVYTAVNRALDRNPSATFDLVAVTPSTGSPAQFAINTNASKRNAENVLRSLADMGLPAERVKLSAMSSGGASGSEVHIYLR